jgi:hypothetical protein
MPGRVVTMYSPATTSPVAAVTATRGFAWAAVVESAVVTISAAAAGNAFLMSGFLRRVTPQLQDVTTFGR